MSFRRVLVYLGSKPGGHPDYLQAASDLGRQLAQDGCEVVYGGAKVGTMGALADATLAAGGRITGIIPQGLVDMEVAHEGLTERLIVQSMHERKMRMIELSDAIITLPGGYGSHDELFEALAWSQLGIHSLPVGLLNVRGYYDGLLAHLEHSVEEGFLAPAHLALLVSDPCPSRLLQLVRDLHTAGVRRA